LGSEEVCNGLVGVQEGGQGVDDGDVGVEGVLLEIGLVVGADHDPIDVAGEDARGVADQLAPSELYIPRREEESMSAELVASDLEGNPGTGRALLEDHGEGLTGEG